MSEYQRYEFMTIERPLTQKQLDAVNGLSSHIEASSTHAIIEYHWGDFKHNPIAVLREFFDGFLYWANWGAPQLALRFPRGILPADLVEGYDFDDSVTFTRHSDYDILDIHFGEMEAPDEWTNYELGSLIGIRDELMEGDLRALYIAWLANQRMSEGYYDGEDEEDEEDEENEEMSAPPVPPAFGTLTAAQEALAELLQVPQELLVAATRHSKAAMSTTGDDIAAWVTLLSPEHKDDYLVRLARNEPGLSRLLVRELRELSQDKHSEQSTGERVIYSILLAESKAVKAQLEREKREQEQAVRQRQLQNIHNHQDDYWQQVDEAVMRGSGTGYDEAAQVLVELREVANHFKETAEFQERFRAWVRPHLHRPAFIKRLQTRKFPLPEA
jgi:hypothetical protein